MSALEDFMNRLTDQDWGWRPFLFLCPPRDRDIDNAVLIKMAACFGPTMALLVVLLRLFMRHPVTPIWIVSVFVLCPVAFFVGYKFTFAAFWNRRARRLRSGRLGGAQT